MKLLLGQGWFSFFAVEQAEQAEQASHDFHESEVFFPRGSHAARWYSLNCVQDGTCDRPGKNPL